MQETNTPASFCRDGFLIEHDIGIAGVVAAFIIRHVLQEVASDLLEAVIEEPRTEGLHRRLRTTGVLGEGFAGIENASEHADVLDTDP